MNEEETFDIGQNAETLGFWYLFLRYILPVIISIALAIGLGYFVLWFVRIALSVPTVAIPTLH